MSIITVTPVRFDRLLLARKRRLEVLEQRMDLKKRLQSLVEEEKWLLEVAALSERGFVPLHVDSDSPASLPQQPQQQTTAATTTATVTAAAERLVNVQDIAALMMYVIRSKHVCSCGKCGYVFCDVGVQGRLFFV